MRAAFALVLAVATIATVGCYHDKYGFNAAKREEYMLPPDEKRYSEPETATFKPKPPTKHDENLMDKMNGRGPGGNGFGGL